MTFVMALVKNAILNLTYKAYTITLSVGKLSLVNLESLFNWDRLRLKFVILVLPIIYNYTADINPTYLYILPQQD